MENGICSFEGSDCDEAMSVGESVKSEEDDDELADYPEEVRALCQVDDDNVSMTCGAEAYQEEKGGLSY